jgi:hypothetical protein
MAKRLARLLVLVASLAVLIMTQESTRAACYGHYEDCTTCEQTSEVLCYTFCVDYCDPYQEPYCQYSGQYCNCRNDFPPYHYNCCPGNPWPQCGL